MLLNTRILVQIVAWNCAQYIEECLQCLFRLEGFEVGKNLFIRITDNDSHDDTVKIIEKYLASGIEFDKSTVNRGFCFPNNQAAQIVLDRGYDALLMLNSDAFLEQGSLKIMNQALALSDRVGAVSPILLSAESRTSQDPRIDSAGIELSSSLRHFDRFQGRLLSECKIEQSEVFGGTGACLLVSSRVIRECSFWGEDFEKDVEKLYPWTKEPRAQRAQLLDEAFFAYREDAELAWRMQRLGFVTIFQPEARVYHVRHVTPSRRNKLSSAINALGVRNRFLLQFNHLSWKRYHSTWIPGVFLRNIFVVFAVLLFERSSFHGLKEAWQLRKRARERHYILEEKARENDFPWFRAQSRSLNFDKPTKRLP